MRYPGWARRSPRLLDLLYEVHDLAYVVRNPIRVQRRTFAGGYPRGRWERLAYDCADRGSNVIALVGLHLMLGGAEWWRRHRWCLERLAAHRWYVLEEGGYYRDGHWVWNEPRFV